MNIPSSQIEIKTNVLFIPNQTNSQIGLIFKIHLNDELDLVLYGVHKKALIPNQQIHNKSTFYPQIMNTNLQTLDLIEIPSRDKQPWSSGRID